MRASWALAVAGLLLVAAGFHAGAHEDGVAHGALFTGSLAPSQSVTRHLDFQGGPLLGGWVFLLVAKVHGAPLGATLSVGGTAAASWTIPTTPAERWIATTVLPRDGVYELTLANGGGANATFAIYFDQSCNCVGKFIPAEIPDGIIIFNTDATERGVVSAQFNEPRAMRIRVSAALLADVRGLWPSDFTILAVSNAPVQRQVKPELPPVWLHELSVEVDGPARVYYFLEGLALDTRNYTGPQDLLVTPFFPPRPQSGSPPTWILLPVAAVLAGFAVFLLWRSRQVETPRKGTPKKSVSRPAGGRGGRRTRTSRRRRR